MAGRQLYDDPKRNEKTHPHIVELRVPENGFGTTLDAIGIFHVQLGIEQRRGKGRRDDSGDYVRWCFVDPQTAAQFQGLFGGQLILGKK